jgi:hypothetical protein
MFFCLFSVLLCLWLLLLVAFGCFFSVERVPMEITRWRARAGDHLSNYVLLQAHLCLKLDAAKDRGGPEAVFDAATVKRVDATLAASARVGEKNQLH